MLRERGGDAVSDKEKVLRRYPIAGVVRYVNGYRIESGMAYLSEKKRNAEDAWADAARRMSLK